MSEIEADAVSEYTTPSAEEMAVSIREHPTVPRSIIERAIGMACDRGGSTIPVGSYDILRAQDEAAGNASENAKLRAELDVVKAQAAGMLEALRPFVDLGPQQGAWGVISKSLDGLAPLTVTVTKAQMLAAIAAVRKATPARLLERREG